MEVKTVKHEEGSRAFSPDAITSRGQKHLRELMEMVRLGHRGVIIFVVPHHDVEFMAPADGIDPDYGRFLHPSVARGVEVLAYRAFVAPESIRLVHPIFRW